VSLPLLFAFSFVVGFGAVVTPRPHFHRHRF